MPEENKTSNSSDNDPSIKPEVDTGGAVYVSGSVDTGGGTFVGRDQVIFKVTDEVENEIHERTENQAGFCIFGGGEPFCNLWVFEDFVYKWEPGGDPVEDDNYQLAVRVIMESGDEGNWTSEIVLRLN